MSYESLEEAKKYHEQNKNFWTGESLAEYKYDVWTLIKQRNYKNILDYGCGKAKYHPEEWNATKYGNFEPPYNASVRRT